MEAIQVLGQKDVRKNVVAADPANKRMGGLTVDKGRINKTFAGDTLEEAVEGTRDPRRYVKGMSRPPKRVFINRKDCPVRNHFEGLPSWSRKDAINAFDSWLWQQQQKDAIPQPAKDWFNARVKEFMRGHNIDLVDDIPHVEDIDDSHGYSLKNYIELLAKESNN